MPTRRLTLAALACSLTGAPTAVAADTSPAEQRDRQKRVLADVEQTARRVTTTLRVLSYQKLDPAAEHKVLDEVAAGLRGLGGDQLRAVLAHLENAVKAPDEATATAEQREAYQKHRQAVASLRELLTRLDVVKSLDAAADRFDRLARRQFDLHEQSVTADQVGATWNRGRRSVDVRDEYADGQGDVRTELATLATQLSGLRGTLAPDQKDRLEKAGVAARGGRLVVDMTEAAAALQSGNFRAAAGQQHRAAQELQSLAAALRTPSDKVAALRDARDKVEKVREAEEKLKAETAAKPDLTDPDQRPKGDRARQDPKTAHVQQLAGKQSRLEFDSREARKAVEAAAGEVAGKLKEAEAEMRRAADDLRSTNTKPAATAQQTAVDRLTEARDKLDDLLAAAVTERTDPLAAAKKAAREIEQLIRDQKAAKKTTEANKDKPAGLKPAADAQKDVARKAAEVQALPRPENPAAADALAKASTATNAAADALAKPDAEAAGPEQASALKALAEAKKALDEQAAGIEKRRADLAKLEAAAEKLDELTKAEKKLAEDAAKAGDPKSDKEGAAKPDPADLARKQNDLTPPTKAVGEDVKAAAPKAAEALGDAARAEQAAGEALGKNDPKAGADKAGQAAKKLDAAKAEVEKKRDELTAQEATDQAALQPNKVDPSAAAQQVAKAIEQANRAAEQAGKAAEQLAQPRADGEATQDLSELQKQLAERAAKGGQSDAARPAADAAKALEAGDLGAAARQQQAARDQLRKAAENGSKPSGELADDQQKLLDATEALAAADRANAEAQAALGQGQAQAPEAVRPQLDGAARQLQQAAKKLGQGKPAEAGRADAEAGKQLTQALNALNAAAQAMNQPTAQPGQNPQASAATPAGQQPGQTPGQKPGQGQQPGRQSAGKSKPGTGQEKNEGAADGDRTGPGEGKAATARGADAQGDGSFINLQKREREKVQQNAEAAFPAEFREQIKQYNINIKDDGKPRPPAPAPAPGK